MTVAFVDSASDALVKGDVVCLIADTAGMSVVTKAVALAISSSGFAYGVAEGSAPAGQRVNVIRDGLIPSSVTGLTAVSGKCRVSSLGRCEYVATYQVGDVPIGTVDSRGFLLLVPSIISTVSLSAASGAAALAALRSIDISGNVNRQRFAVDALNAGFVWRASDGAGVADDAINIIKPDSLLLAAAGRYYRDPQVQTESVTGVIFSGPVDVRVRGAVVDGSTNDYAALSASIATASPVDVPSGTLKATLPGSGPYTTIAPSQSVLLAGIGSDRTTIQFTPTAPTDATVTGLYGSTPGKRVDLDDITIAGPLTSVQYTAGIYSAGGTNAGIRMRWATLDSWSMCIRADADSNNGERVELWGSYLRTRDTGVSVGSSQGNCVLHSGGWDPRKARLDAFGSRFSNPSSSQSHCLYLNEGVGARTIGCDFESSYGYGIHHYGGLDNGAPLYSIHVANYFDRNLSAAAISPVAARQQIVACAIHGKGLAVRGPLLVAATVFAGGDTTSISEFTPDTTMVADACVYNRPVGPAVSRHASTVAGLWTDRGATHEGGSASAERYTLPGGKTRIVGAHFVVGGIADDDAIKTAIATSTSIVSWTGSAINGVAAHVAIPRLLTFTSSASAGAYNAASPYVVTFINEKYEQDTHSFQPTANGGNALTSTKLFRSILSIAGPAQVSAAGSIKFGSSPAPAPLRNALISGSAEVWVEGCYDELPDCPWKFGGSSVGHFYRNHWTTAYECVRVDSASVVLYGADNRWPEASGNGYGPIGVSPGDGAIGYIRPLQGVRGTDGSPIAAAADFGLSCNHDLWFVGGATGISRLFHYGSGFASSIFFNGCLITLIPATGATFATINAATIGDTTIGRIAYHTTAAARAVGVPIRFRLANGLWYEV
jgi:hypothetical protein